MGSRRNLGDSHSTGRRNPTCPRERRLHNGTGWPAEPLSSASLSRRPRSRGSHTRPGLLETGAGSGSGDAGRRRRSWALPSHALDITHPAEIR